jgi:hypothetical protein
MVELGWDRDRAMRPRATECFSLYFHQHQLCVENKFDIFFSHAWADKPFLSHIFAYLVTCGYRVWYDQNEMGLNLQASMVQGIGNSKVVIVCADSTYQSRPHCLFELSEARKLPDKPTITLVIEPDPLSWATEAMTDLCRFETQQFVDISELRSLHSRSGDDAMLNSKFQTDLKQAMDPLIRLLRSVDCLPSLSLVAGEKSSVEKSLSSTES